LAENEKFRSEFANSWQKTKNFVQNLQILGKKQKIPFRICKFLAKNGKFCSEFANSWQKIENSARNLQILDRKQQIPLGIREFFKATLDFL